MGATSKDGILRETISHRAVAPYVSYTRRTVPTPPLCPFRSTRLPTLRFVRKPARETSPPFRKPILRAERRKICFFKIYRCLRSLGSFFGGPPCRRAGAESARCEATRTPISAGADTAGASPLIPGVRGRNGRTRPGHDKSARSQTHADANEDVSPAFPSLDVAAAEKRAKLAPASAGLGRHIASGAARGHPGGQNPRGQTEEHKNGVARKRQARSASACGGQYGAYFRRGF